MSSKTLAKQTGSKSSSNVNVLEFVQKYTMVIVLGLVLILFSIMTGGNIILPQNVNSLISQNAYVFILATGMLLCILTGGNIDLSVGSLVCFVGAIGGRLMTDTGIPMPVIVIILFAVGTLIGAWQAFWIAYVRIPPFIVTLSGMLIFRGLSNVVLNGYTIPLNDFKGFNRVFGGGANCYIPDFFKNESINITCLIFTAVAVAVYAYFSISNRVKRMKKNYEVEKYIPWMCKLVLICAAIAAFGIQLARYKGVPNVLLIIAGVIIIYTYITSNTTTGRYFYAVGGNEKATTLSGINTNKVYFLAYANMGLLSALAGLVNMARFSSASPITGQSYEMDAIASCFIGGASAYGGIGTVPGVIIGALLMGVINIGMNSVGVDQNWQQVVKGGVLLAAVIFDVVSKRGGKWIAKNS